MAIKRIAISKTASISQFQFGQLKSELNPTRQRIRISHQLKPERENSFNLF